MPRAKAGEADPRGTKVSAIVIIKRDASRLSKIFLEVLVTNTRAGYMGLGGGIASRGGTETVSSQPRPVLHKKGVISWC